MGLVEYDRKSEQDVSEAFSARKQQQLTRINAIQTDDEYTWV